MKISSQILQSVCYAWLKPIIKYKILNIGYFTFDLNFIFPILILDDSMKTTPCKSLVQFLNMFDINPNTQSGQ